MKIKLEDFKNKVVLIYGHSGEGKTTCLSAIAGEIARQTNKKPLYVATDANIKGQFKKQIEQLLGTKVYVPMKAYNVIKAARELKDDTSCFILDSISGYGDMYLYWGEHPTTVTRLVSGDMRTLTIVLQRKMRMQELYAFLVTHAVTLFGDTWKGEGFRPMLAGTAMRNCDVIIKHELVNEDYLWTIKIWRDVDYVKYVGKQFRPLDLLKGEAEFIKKKEEK